MCTLGSATYSSWNKLKRKRNKQFGHTDLFRYFKIFNKCIDFGCIFIVVHRNRPLSIGCWQKTLRLRSHIAPLYCSKELDQFWLCHILVVMIMPWSSWLNACLVTPGGLVTGRRGWSCCWRWCCEALCTWSPAASRSWTGTSPPPGLQSAWGQRFVIFKFGIWN